MWQIGEESVTEVVFIESPQRQLGQVEVALINGVPAPAEKARQESFVALGQVEPVRLRPTLDGRYDIVDGRRRVVNLAANGVTTIEAIVEAVDDETAAWHALALNISRAASPMVEARLIGKLRQRHYTQKQIAARLGLSGSSQALISQREALLDLIPALQDKLERGEMTIQAARYITSTRHKLPLAAQEELGGLAKVTIKEAKEMLRRYQAEMVDLGAIDVPTMESEPVEFRLLPEQWAALSGGQPVTIQVNGYQIIITR